MVSHEDFSFYSLAVTDNRKTFDTLYFRDKEVLRVYDESFPPPDLDELFPKMRFGFVNDVLKAERTVVYLKGTQQVPYYFWVVDEFQKDISQSFEYDWHISTRTYNEIDLNTPTNNPVKIYRPTADPTLDIYIIKPDNYQLQTSSIPLVPNHPYSEAKKLSILQTAVSGDYNILLLPYKSNDTSHGHNYSDINMITGSGVVLHWNTGYDDYAFYSGNGGLSGSTISSDARHIFLRKVAATGKYIHYFLLEGSFLTLEGAQIVDLYGQTAKKIVYDNEVLKVYGNNINRMKIYAPYATQVELNDQPVSFYRLNDYVYMETSVQTLNWHGNVYVSGNVVVNAADELTIAEGSSISFDLNSQLVVNGVINCNGSVTDTIYFTASEGNEGYGVRIVELDDPYSAQGAFSYCHFEGLLKGVEAINSYLTITNSWIGNCSEGVALLNADGLVEENIIQFGLNGIYVDGCAPSVQNNTISNCGHGIYIISGSGNYFENTITECGQSGSGEIPEPGGLYALSGASPVLSREEIYSLNSIENSNGFGMKADQQSTVFAGDTEIPGGNIIAQSSTFDAEAKNKSTIWAIENYWGVEEPLDKQFDKDEGSEVYYEPFLSDPPTMTMLASTPSHSKKIYSESSNASYNSSKTFNPQNWQRRLLQLFFSGQHTNLISLGDSLLKTSLYEKEMIFILSLMHHSSIASTDSSFATYLNGIVQQITNTNFKRLGSMYLLQNYLKYYELTKARRIVQMIQTQFSGSHAEAHALFRAFQILLYYENNKTDAGKVYTDLKNKYPEHPLTWTAKIQLEGIDGYHSFRNKLLFPKVKPRSDLENPQMFTLYQNFPNPFNPSTKITYVIPKTAKVTLSIYNILGQKVKTLVEQVLNSGKYQTTWNGQNQNGEEVVSGIYIYRILVQSYDGQEQFGSSKKMILLR